MQLYYTLRCLQVNLTAFMDTSRQVATESIQLRKMDEVIHMDE